jgi:hypothetical protein
VPAGKYECGLLCSLRHNSPFPILDSQTESGDDDSAKSDHLRKVAARLCDYAGQLANIVKPQTPQ